MNDISGIREECTALLVRLEATPRLGEIAAIHRDLAPVVGQLQGAVNGAKRTHGETDAVREAELSLGRLKAGVRQVGLDIRLASESALTLGLHTALESAFETIDRLEHITPETSA